MKHVYPSGEYVATESLYGSTQLGYYPIGRLNTWHGGIHIEGNEPINVIADGVIIAFRVAKDYHKELIDGKISSYSSSFVLVQHFYKSPKGQELAYYSLYQHLLPESEMENETIPPFLTKTVYLVNTDVNETIDNTTAGKLIKGARERDGKNGKTILRIIPHNVEITIKKDGEWGLAAHAGQTAADKKGYVWLKNLHKKKVCKLTPSQLGIVNKISIPVKAGEIIGQTGFYGIEKKENYRAAHIEVFTHEDVEPFLNDSKDDGKDLKNYLKITAGAVLKKAYPHKLVATNSIKILEKGDVFTHIHLHKLFATVEKAWMESGIISQAEGGKYTYLPKDLAKLNEKFDGQLTKTSLLVLEEIPAGVSLKTTRYVSFSMPPDREAYWVKTLVLGANKDATTEFFPAANITELYLTQPNAGKLEETLVDTIEIELKQCKTITDSDNQSWYYIDVADRYLQKSGYIKTTDHKLKKISAYNWTEFGFKLFKDNDDEYIYDCEAPIKFLNDVWNQIDTDGNKVLTPLELFNAHKQPHIVKKLTRLVCHHTNEWAYAGAKLAGLKAKVEKLFNKGIKNEQDPERKKTLETLKIERLDGLDRRVRALCFWNELSGYKPELPPETIPEIIESELHKQMEAILPGSSSWGSTEFAEWLLMPTLKLAKLATKKETPVPLQPFPASPMVYHFHPVAFVEQMRRMEGCFCEIDRDFFYAMYKSEFSELSKENKDDIEIIFQGIESYKTVNDSAYTISQIAYILATIKHETGNYKPVIESYWLDESQRKQYYEEMYDPVLGKDITRRNMAINSGNTKEGDGVLYAGKGYVQITWKKNYKKAKDKFGFDCVSNPNLVLIPENSIKIALDGFDFGSFTGKSIHDYINDEKTDYNNARRVINGTDCAESIKGIAEKMEKCLNIK